MLPIPRARSPASPLPIPCARSGLSTPNPSRALWHLRSQSLARAPFQGGRHLLPKLPEEEEMTLIRDITVAAEAHSKEGDTFFLITNRWWQSWIDYVIKDLASATSNGSHHHEFGSNTTRRPGAIDNTDLIDDTASEVSSMDIELHDTLVEGRDYILLPQQVWEKLRG